MMTQTQLFIIFLKNTVVDTFSPSRETDCDSDCEEEEKCCHFYNTGAGRRKFRAYYNLGKNFGIDWKMRTIFEGTVYETQDRGYYWDK